RSNSSEEELRDDRRGAEGHPGVPGLQGGPDLRGDAHHLPALPEGLPHSRRHPGHADQRSGAVDVQAVILAGGQGTRLRPLTHTRPKPIVPLLDRPFLHYQLALLRQHGITDVILSCSYRVADIRAAMGTGDAAGVRLRYVVEATPLGTAGGLRNAAALARGRLVVLNGDVLTDADLGAVLGFHAARQAGVTIGLVPSRTRPRTGSSRPAPTGPSDASSRSRGPRRSRPTSSTPGSTCS